MIYFDNASTTQLAPELLEVIKKYSVDCYGNAGSKYDLGRVSKHEIEKGKDGILHTLGAYKSDILFTSCGSESNTMAIVGLTEHLRKNNKHHIITSKYEHHSVLNSMKEMERRGFEVTYLDIEPNGTVSPEKMHKAMREDTGLVSIMFVNNELGTWNDVEKMYDIIKRERGDNKNDIIFHSDFVQAIGTMNINLKNMADSVSISGHKFHAPKGIGALIVRDKNIYNNIIFGGQQEFGLRPGTENVSSIVCLAKMIESSCDTSRICKAKEVFCHFVDLLGKECKNRKIPVSFNTSLDEHHTSKTLSVRFDGVDSETLMLSLNAKGICVSAGSACSSNSSNPSHVLKALGLTDDQARSTIRVSFSDYNTLEEVDEAVPIIIQCVERLNELKASLIS